ncbi:MAG: hypothetical protein IAE80_03080 [Anaerolinea sp.]|nr:hypothetical protein [Anaerolinea sp.]
MAITLPLILSVITSVISAIFTLVVFNRWRSARAEGKARPHLLAWAIGLLLYFIGAFAQVILYFTWSQPAFALWYWAGALMTAPWLGQGTIYLLWRKGSIARNIQMALILVSVMTLPWALFLTPMNGDAWRPGADMVVLMNDIMQKGGVRGFVPMTNIWGTLALVGGAIYSAWLFRRKGILANRAYGNWLIAAGGLLPALGGALIRLNLTDLKYGAEMLGVILIFAGYLLTMRTPEDAPAPKQRQPVRESA